LNEKIPPQKNSRFTTPENRMKCAPSFLKKKKRIVEYNSIVISFRGSGLRQVCPNHYHPAAASSHPVQHTEKKEKKTKEKKITGQHTAAESLYNRAFKMDELKKIS
jgi:hypothetical protein